MTKLITEDAKGVYIIAATPFGDDGRLDLESIDSLVDFYIATGIAGMTILGMMGEATKLSEKESIDVMMRFLHRTNGRVPVVVGVSNPGTDALLRFSATAMEAGAAGVMVAPISTIKTEEQAFNYFASVCKGLGAEIPVVLQDFPFATNVYLSVDCIIGITEAFPQIRILKHEDCPGLNKLTRLRKASTEAGRRRLSILVGSGGLYLPQELARGADGAMTGFGYPEILVEVVERFAQGDREGGEDIFDTYLPLLRHEAQPGIGLALRKEILRRRGAIRSGFVRSPGMSLKREDHDELSELIRRVERRAPQAANTRFHAA